MQQMRSVSAVNESSKKRWKIIAKDVIHALSIASIM
jgi:hypothetical protein